MYHDQVPVVFDSISCKKVLSASKTSSIMKEISIGEAVKSTERSSTHKAKFIGCYK